MRDSEAIFNEVVQALAETKTPHVKMYFLGIKAGGRPARVAMRKVKVLAAEYVKVSMAEQKAMTK